MKTKQSNSRTIRIHDKAIARLDSLVGWEDMNRSGIVALACAVLRIVIEGNGDELPGHEPDATDRVAAALLLPGVREAGKWERLAEQQATLLAEYAAMNQRLLDAIGGSQ